MSRPPLDLGSLIAPASVAVVGASPDGSGHSGRAHVNLARTGYAGRVFPVNPRYEEIDGLRCYPSVLEIEEEVEAAYVLVAAKRALPVVEQCIERGVRTITICSSGFIEVGEEGEEMQRRLVETARANGVRLLGPNCIGVINVAGGYVPAPTFNITYDYVPGGVTMLSQSGGTAVTVLNRAQGLGIGMRCVVSVGNEADLDVAELVDAFVDDPETRALALFLEHLRDGPRFLAAAERAMRAEKPIVALRVGKSAAARRSILSHTGAIAAERGTVSDALAQAGVVEVGSVDELMHSAHLLATAPAPAGPRIGFVCPSGGEASYSADLATARGLEVAELDPATKEFIAGELRFGNPENPLDLTGQVIGDPEMLKKVLAAFARDPNLDLMAVMIATWGAHDAESLFPHFLAAVEEAEIPAAMAAWSARNLTERADEILRQSGQPTFDSGDAAIAALANLHRYWNVLRRERGEVPAGRPLKAPPGEGIVTERRGKELLAAAGVAVTREVLAGSLDEAKAALDEVGGRAVLKLLADGVAHKSELGLVRPGVEGAAEVAEVWAEFEAIAEREGLSVEGVLVAEHVDGVEAIVGGIRDATFGPMAMIGAGGIYAESLGDVVFRVCPLSAEEARAAVESLRFHAVLAGARGRSYDVDSLVEAIAAFSAAFAASDWIEEIDLNPVIVRQLPARGAVAADAVIRRRPAPVFTLSGSKRGSDEGG